jgi:hypothetical protein
MAGLRNRPARGAVGTRLSGPCVTRTSSSSATGCASPRSGGNDASTRHPASPPDQYGSPVVVLGSAAGSGARSGR